MLGRIIIDILFGAALVATISYFLSEDRKSEKLKLIGRYSFYVVFGGIILTSGYFLYLILSHDFQFTYVWSYSSRELNGFLLVASFYAGQEGSFMLWSTMLAIVGISFLPYAKKKDYESVSMGFYSLILAFVLLLLIVKSPFTYVWESFEEVAKGFTPANGRGMNPVLENYWITIHPPILFSGYAIMSVAYVLAVSGLIKRDYRNWVNVALPWILMSAGILTLGIGLGGFWAYETLGWGGFWGWDPVENSSLLPCLISIALLHTMLVQRHTGGLVKTNYLLGILSFIFVLYATFLTRSGVLGDMSVHSFADPGGLIYVLLLIFLLVFLFIGLTLLFLRIKDLNYNKASFSMTSRETYVTFGAILLLISTAIVFIGTSFPIFLELTGQTKTSVDISFYDKWNLPIATLFMFLCGFSFFLTWKNAKANRIKQAILPGIISVLAVLILWWSGVSQTKHLVLAFGSVYCLYVGVLFFLQVVRKTPSKIGAFISHAGIGVFFLGVIFSGGYPKSTSLMLAKGETKEALGYKFTFIGSDRIELDKKDREKYKCNIKIEKDENFTLASPIVYWSDFNQKQAPFFQPGIDESLSKDLYLSPKSLSYHSDLPTVALFKDQSALLPLDTSYKMTLIGFDMSHGMSQNQSNQFVFGGILNFEKNGKSTIDTLYIGLDMSTGNSTPYWYEIENTDISVGFSNFDLNQDDMTKSQAIFSIAEKGNTTQSVNEFFSFEITVKPFISFVWVGALAMVAGFFIALFKYKFK